MPSLYQFSPSPVVSFPWPLRKPWRRQPVCQGSWKLPHVVHLCSFHQGGQGIRWCSAVLTHFSSRKVKTGCKHCYCVKALKAIRDGPCPELPPRPEEPASSCQVGFGPGLRGAHISLASCFPGGALPCRRGDAPGAWGIRKYLRCGPYIGFWNVRGFILDRRLCE